MAKDKKMLLIYYVICAVVILGSTFILRYRIIQHINNNFLNKEVSELNLKKEEKIEDFEEFYNNIVEGVPSINDQATLYGTDFKNRRDYYLGLIESTKGDFEFFCTMLAIQKDIPSKHTDICFPEYSNILNLNGYNTDQTLSRHNIKPLTEYWYQCIKDSWQQFSEVKRANFKYIDGQYLFDTIYSSDIYENLHGFELISINDQPMSDYVVNHISTYNLRYDYKRNVPYRWYLTLNDSIGQKVNVTFSDSDNGSVINKELYIDIQIEVVDLFSYIYEEEKSKNKESDESIYSYFDDENDIAYVSVRNFTNSQGEELVATLEKTKTFENIIIDLRNNYGGIRDYGNNYLYSPLYSDDITTTLNWVVADSDANKVINNKLSHRLFYKQRSTENGFNYTRKYIYKGKSPERKQSIYYLTNMETASAADGYIALVKENNLGTIVGTNTYGEGTAGSFNSNSLKNSGLVHIYFPSYSYNQDGTNNAVYGTSPDIYIEQSKDSFYKQRELEKKQKDINTYNEKVKYDNVLIQTIKIIQKGKE